MRYLDIIKNGLTENVGLNTFRFKSQIPSTINFIGTGNLQNKNNVEEVLEYIDTSYDVNEVVKYINDSTIFYEGSPSIEHIFTHNLNTNIFKYDIWVLESAGWQNSIVPITIIDNSSVKVELTDAKSCRIIVQDIQDIPKVYNVY